MHPVRLSLCCVLCAFAAIAVEPAGAARVPGLTRELAAQRPRRIQALWALYRMGPAANSATTALLKALYNEELEDVPLVMSVLAQVAPEDPRVVQELTDRIKYDTQAIRVRARYLLRALASQPGQARDTLFAAFGRDRELSDLLLDLGPTPAADLFSKLLRLPEAARSHWLNLFRVYGQQPYAPEIVQMLSREVLQADEQRAGLALVLLQQVGAHAEGALPAVTECLSRAQTPERSILACTTLATIGSAGVPGIVRTLARADVQTQLQLVSLLEIMGTAARPAAGALRQLAKKTDNGILRMRIASALAAINP